MLRQYKLKDYDFKLILCVIALSVIGVLAIGRTKNELLRRQILGMGAGIFVMLLLSFIDYSFILYFYWILYFCNIVLLLIVTLFGININGAQRWVNILGIQFQPSESAKILLILFFAQFIMKYREELNTIKFLAFSFFLLCIPLFLVYKQPNLSTSIVIVVVFCSLLFVGGLSYKILLGVLAVIVPAVTIIFVIVLQPNQQLIEPYQAGRILSWLQPDKYADTLAYQQLNSITAIGSGQLWGKGLNNNVIASVKNGNFLLEAETDFIFAIIGEELGFVGCAVVIALLFLTVVECIYIGSRAKDLQGRLLCCGMATWIGFQSFVNIGVNTGLLPNTGVPLPFVSYGLSSVIAIYIGMGFVLNVGLQPKKY